MTSSRDISKRTEKIGSNMNRDLKLIGKYDVGEYGAFKVQDSEGNNFVLKLSPDPNWYQQIERARKVTNALRLIGYPVSEYIFISHDQDGSYWLQKKIEGKTIDGDPTLGQLRQLVELIELQADKQAPKEQNWSRYVKSVVFEDESGWLDAIKECSSTGDKLIREVSRMVVGLDAIKLPVADIVHGDYTADQVLVKDKKIMGVVDWDAVGCGDRGLDLASFLFDLYKIPKIEELLRSRLLKISGKNAARLYLIYRMLAVTAWQIQERSNELAIGEGLEKLKYIEETF